jgi:hypothetical protein
VLEAHPFRAHNYRWQPTIRIFAMTKNSPGSRTNPEGVPQEGHGGSNVRDTQHQQGKDGNGAQKRQQEKKS